MTRENNTKTIPETDLRTVSHAQEQATGPDLVHLKVGESHEREIRLYDDRFGRRGRRR